MDQITRSSSAERLARLVTSDERSTKQLKQWFRVPTARLHWRHAPYLFAPFSQQPYESWGRRGEQHYIKKGVAAVHLPAHSHPFAGMGRGVERTRTIDRCRANPEGGSSERSPCNLVHCHDTPRQRLPPRSSLVLDYCTTTAEQH